MANLDDILAADLDVLMLGRADLSVKLGLGYQPTHPEVEKHAVAFVDGRGRTGRRHAGLLRRGGPSVDRPGGALRRLLPAGDLLSDATGGPAQQSSAYAVSLLVTGGAGMAVVAAARARGDVCAGRLRPAWTPPTRSR